MARAAVLSLLFAILVPVATQAFSGAAQFADLALACVHQEYPNKITHVLESDADVAPPRSLTPVFFGCYDWHSAVHGHWLLVRLLRLHPDLPQAAAIEAALDQSFDPQRVAAEVSYLAPEARATFERPYGTAWLLQLTAELREWDDPRARRWLTALEPLEAAYRARLTDWLDKLAYPIRSGEHAQTAFAFALFIDWARTAGDNALLEQVGALVRRFHQRDVDCPLAYEPSGQDFLSPCLAEADLMRRVLSPVEYAVWLRAFLPGIPADGSADWLPLAEVTDRSDGKLAHLDGLHLSRAWALRGIAAGLPGDDPRVAALAAAAKRQATAGLAAVTGEHYEGGHWLGSFAVYLVTGRSAGTGPIPDEPVPDLALPLQRIETMRARMARWEPSVNAVIALSPDLEDQARSAAAAEPQGPLHGWPVLLKDNIETRELPTTAGSLALAGNRTGRDAELTRRLRAAGLVIAGKANLSEWANFRDRQSTSGWSAVGGLTRNPWDPARSACGSSTGSAVVVAAGYVPFAVGTETDGSIVCPASHTGIVGIKPTVGLISRRGIVPIAHSQDTAGPMAHSVRAAALLLSAMEGEDAEDAATVAARAHFGRDYTASFRADGLEGLHIGVVRSSRFGAGVEDVFQQAVADLAAGGAALTDPLALPEWPAGFWDQSLDVLLYEFRHDLEAYLATLPGEYGALTLERLIAFNQEQAGREMPWFGQDLFEDALKKGGLDSAGYRVARDSVQAFTRAAVDGLLAEHDLDLLVLPTNALAFSIDLVHGDTWHGGTSSIAAIAGYPHVTVPMGQVKGLPAGLSFIGTAFSEPVLLRAAYAYEQATRHRRTLEGPEPWDLEE